ncbi:serine-rich adhesin for platelets-like [Branchiostoma lanceolatum]|uniref:serine-rich adhesin for platelets-like n=1 Tax=Branchiostoma lanceolatum TaxID=7740 RepID=UPI00345252AD
MSNIIEDALTRKWGSCDYSCVSVYSNASCVPDAFSCDGDADCAAGEDEQGCGNVDGSSTQVSTTPSAGQHNPAVGQGATSRPTDGQDATIGTLDGQEVTRGITDAHDPREGPIAESTTGQGSFESHTDGEALPKGSASKVMAIGHNQTGQGQSQAITESNTSTTAAIVTSGHDHTEQGESRALAQILKVGNLSHNDVLAALQPNPMYTYVGKGTQPNDPMSTAMALAHDLTGQSPFQAIPESNTNTVCTDAVVTSDHGQTEQGQSQATVESLDARNLSYGTGPTASKLNSLYKVEGQYQPIIKSNTNTTAAVTVSGRDNEEQGNYHTTTESDTNTTATIVASGHDHTGQGQSQDIAQPLKVGNLSHDQVLAALQPNPMYTYVGKGTQPKDPMSTAMALAHDLTGQSPFQAIPESNTNTMCTDAVVTSDHGQTEQGQSQATVESLDARNLSYGTGPTASKQNSLYKVEGQYQPIIKSNTNTTAAVTVSGRDNEEQGNYYTTTESDTNTTATIVASGHDHTGQGQSQAIAQPLKVGNLSHDQVIAALQPNPMYTYVGKGTQPKDPMSTAMAVGHDLTGQSPCQAIPESNTNTSATVTVVTSAYGQTGQVQSQAITGSNTNTTDVVVTSAHDQTGQGQSQAITESNTNTTYVVVTSAHGQTGQVQSQAITGSNTNTTDVVVTSAHDQTGQVQSQAITESNTNTTDAVMTSTCGHDQTGKGQSHANIQLLKVGILSHKVRAALDPNPMYADGEALPKGSASTVMAIGHNQTGQGQSQAITESNTNTTDVVVTSAHGQTEQGQSQAITESNTNTTDVVVTSAHDQTGQGQSQAITESNTNTTYVVVTSAHGQTEQGQSQTITESNTNTTDAVMTSTCGHDQTGKGQSHANIQPLKVGNLSHEVRAALDPNPMYTDGEALPKGSASKVMAIGHNQTGQGQSQAITESNTSTTAAIVTSGHDHTEQGESQALAQTLKVGNLSHNDVLAALQPNPMYTYVGKGTQPKEPMSIAMAVGQDLTGQSPCQAIPESNTNTTAAVVTSGHDQTGQSQSQAITEFSDARNPSYGTGQTASHRNYLYANVEAP